MRKSRRQYHGDTRTAGDVAAEVDPRVIAVIKYEESLFIEAG